jgi:hypothetical protein
MATEQKVWVNLRVAPNVRDEIREFARRDQRTITGWVRKQIIRGLEAEREQKETQESTKS